MKALTFQTRTTFRKNISEFIIESLKIWLVIQPLQFIFWKRNQLNAQRLKNSAPNSVGNDIHNLLIMNNLKPIPFFEEHDLKHLILGYGMTSEDEVRMQFYLLGNGNRSLFCILFALSGMLLPSSWNTFIKDYHKGKNAPRILDLKLDDCIECKTTEMRIRYKIN